MGVTLLERDELGHQAVEFPIGHDGSGLLIIGLVGPGQETTKFDDSQSFLISSGHDGRILTK